MIEYSLTFQEKSDGTWEVRHESGPSNFPTEQDRVPIDPSQIVPGQYFVLGPKVAELREVASQQEAAQWLADLHESEGKEAGDGMKPYLVFRRK